MHMGCITWCITCTCTCTLCVPMRSGQRGRTELIDPVWMDTDTSSDVDQADEDYTDADRGQDTIENIDCVHVVRRQRYSLKHNTSRRVSVVRQRTAIRAPVHRYAITINRSLCSHKAMQQNKKKPVFCPPLKGTFNTSCPVYMCESIAPPCEAGKARFVDIWLRLRRCVDSRGGRLVSPLALVTRSLSRRGKGENKVNRCYLPPSQPCKNRHPVPAEI